jgi:hypothetical protein
METVRLLGGWGLHCALFENGVKVKVTVTVTVKVKVKVFIVQISMQYSADFT